MTGRISTWESVKLWAARQKYMKTHSREETCEKFGHVADKSRVPRETSGNGKYWPCRECTTGEVHEPEAR